MNLLYTITAYPPSVGGAQAQFHELARRLHRHHRLQVVAHWTETRTDWLLGTTLRSPRRATTSYLDGVPVSLLSFTAAEQMALLPAVVGYYLFKGPAIRRISDRILRRLGSLAQGADLVHNGRIGREGLSFASLRLARHLGVPFVLTPFHHPRWTGWNYRHYLDIYRQADAVVALTHAEKDALIRLGVEARRVFVTGMGPVLAPAPNASRFRRRYALDGPVVLFLGQKYPYKGCAALLRAAPLVWKELPQTRFVFIGPRTRHSRSLFARVGDPRILEIEIVDLETKTDALAACDLLCLPSSQESFGAVFVEAWMLGKPVVAGPAPASREVIDEGVDGFVVAQEPRAIADRLLVLLEGPALRLEMGERGRAKALARYSWECLAAQTEATYRAVLG